MGAVLALASAVCYGLSDFAGGMLSRRASFTAVALSGQVGGLVLTLLAAPVAAATVPTVSAAFWGALSGVGTAVGMVFLFRGLGRGAMSVVSPVSAASGVAIPVAVGVAVLGERPSAASWLGIAVAVPALWLVSRDRGPEGTAVTAGASDGLIAGAGFAVQYMALAQCDVAAGIWPIAAGRVAAACTVLVLAKAAGSGSFRLPPRLMLYAAATGGGAALALVCYLLAARQELMVVAVVLSSLYPVVPVVLGLTVLRERLSRQQVAGLAGALLAVGLITVS